MCRLHLAADFGQWSDFGDCMCDSKKYRSRVCEAEPCVGDYVDSEDCDCVPLDAAGIQFLSDIHV